MCSPCGQGVLKTRRQATCTLTGGPPTRSCLWGGDHKVIPFLSPISRDHFGPRLCSRLSNRYCRFLLTCAQIGRLSNKHCTFLLTCAQIQTSSPCGSSRPPQRLGCSPPSRSAPACAAQPHWHRHAGDHTGRRWHLQPQQHVLEWCTKSCRLRRCCQPGSQAGRQQHLQQCNSVL